MHLATCTVIVGDCCGYAVGYAYALQHFAGAGGVLRVLRRTDKNESLAYIRYRIVVKGYWSCCLCLLDLLGVNRRAVSSYLVFGTGSMCPCLYYVSGFCVFKLFVLYLVISFYAIQYNANLVSHELIISVDSLALVSV